ncbi:hypothetical protein [Fluviicola sp.]|uniref:hypothetical protein n=1 Tax=Fluviicola sp. TaxID=1917219 RepID=UPI0031D8675C
MKRSIVFALFALFTVTGLQAQVGINTQTPDSTAALDIQSPSGGASQRGVLFPRMTSVQRTGMSNPAQSLLVFDTDSMMFYYYVGTRWVGLAAVEPVGSANSGVPNISGDLKLNAGTVSATNINSNTVNTGLLAVNGFSNNALVPTGAIMLWSGTTLPAGWGLCNGHYYGPGGSEFVSLPPFFIPDLIKAPDLSGRFVVGYNPGAAATPATAPADGTTINYGQIGNTGGETGHQLTSAESGLPAHNHNINDPGHYHTMYGYIQSGDGYANGNDNGDGALQGNNAGTSTYSASTGISIQNSATQDASQVHENRPPYYVLAYIIKLP